MNLLLAGLGGFVGSALRYAVGVQTRNLLPHATFPWATFAVNVTGCLLIGVFGAIAEGQRLMGAGARVFLIVGLLGGFTTFSAFSWDTLELMHAGRFGVAAANVVVHMVTCMLAVWLGFLIGTSLVPASA